MKKITYYLLIIITSTNSLIAQCDGRYQTEIFNYAYEDINESKLEKSNFFHIEILK